MKLAYLIPWNILILVLFWTISRRPAGPARVYLFICCNGIWLAGMFWILQQIFKGKP